MKTLTSILAIAILLITSCSQNRGLTLITDNMGLSIDMFGNITELTDRSAGIDYLAKEEPAPLLSLMFDSLIVLPQKASFDNEYTLFLDYGNDITASVTYSVEESHIRFELLAISGNPDLVIWGPYPTTINKIIGETIGVVRGDEFALGIQALNPRTLGGYPWNDNDCMPQIDIFEQDDPTDLSEKGKRGVLYRVEAAKPTLYGSSLQAYCRNRNNERIIENWGFQNYTAPAFNDEGIIGSAIALFGCPVEETLENIGKIEIAENLPHPMIDGEWGKTAPGASAAYIILDFGEEDIDRAIDITKKAGLKYLYQGGPFETWGHFILNEEKFSNGVDGMKMCVEKAAEKGITLGVHILSNFITTNDPYVTPVPDSRLARVGSSEITSPIDPNQESITIESPHFFLKSNRDNLHTVIIGDELITFEELSTNEPWTLKSCTRGAFGTTASSHNAGDTIGRLADHAYKVFLTNPELTIEMSENIAEFFNATGVRQISFDGLEGNRSTGMGNYGEILFTTTWYNTINDNIRQHYIADASRTSHYFWHIYSRMNWGEPWYAGFRESQTDYRMKNQAYFQRNLMPGMLGWFRMTSSTSVEDIEWMLARSAAYNAGYAFVVDYKTLEENPDSDTILELIGKWEKARMEGRFTDEQREEMKDLKKEFHLEIGENGEIELVRK